MAENSAISWTTHTFNPWMGCTKISPACDGCYAEALMDTRYGKVSWGAGEDRVRTAPANWRQPIRWNRQAAETGTRPFVFCASLADVFDNEVDPKWRHDLFDLIEATPHLVWLLLTKRVGNVRRMTDPERGNRCLPRNAAVGATMANQEEYDRDNPKLAEVKRTSEPLFTFGSFEPLLGPVVLDANAPDWIISGGETDQGQHRARPSHPDWFRLLRDRSAALGRIYHHKQNGEWQDGSAFGPAFERAEHRIIYRDGASGPHTRDFCLQRDREGLHAGQHPTVVSRVGKKAAGRLLDGVEHNGMPDSLAPLTLRLGPDGGGDVSALFFVVDLRPEWTRNPYITLWRPNSAGYAYPLPWAGRYTAEEIIASGGYHTQRRYISGKGHVGAWDRFAVACKEIKRLSTPPDLVGRGRIDGNTGPVLRNSADMREHLRRVRFDPTALPRPTADPSPIHPAETTGARS